VNAGPPPTWCHKPSVQQESNATRTRLSLPYLVTGRSLNTVPPPLT
jgi:hypothetical protein